MVLKDNNKIINGMNLMDYQFNNDDVLINGRYIKSKY